MSEPTELTHPQLVTALKKSGLAIIAGLTPRTADAWHMASCICGEAGELFDAVKREAIYEKEVNRDNLIEELGDIEFYLEGLRQCYNISREETLQANVAKLSTRYSSLKYTNQAAQDRVDKQ